jgi:hypothetical protein
MTNDKADSQTDSPPLLTCTPDLVDLADLDDFKEFFPVSPKTFAF